MAVLATATSSHVRSSPRSPHHAARRSCAWAPLLLLLVLALAAPTAHAQAPYVPYAKSTAAENEWVLCLAAPRTTQDPTADRDCADFRRHMGSPLPLWVTSSAAYCGLSPLDRPPSGGSGPAIKGMPNTYGIAVFYVCTSLTQTNNPSGRLMELWDPLHKSDNLATLQTMMENLYSSAGKPRVLFTQLSDEPHNLRLLSTVAGPAKECLKRWCLLLDRPAPGFLPPPPEAKWHIGLVLDGTSQDAAARRRRLVDGIADAPALTSAISYFPAFSVEDFVSRSGAGARADASGGTADGTAGGPLQVQGRGRSLKWPGYEPVGPYPLDYATYDGLFEFVNAPHRLIEPSTSLPDYAARNPFLYAYVGPYLRRTFAATYLNNTDRTLSNNLRTFVQGGGILLVLSTLNVDIKSMVDICATPLAFLDSVLGNPGCRCVDPSIYQDRFGRPSARLNPDAVTQVWGSSVGLPLLAQNASYVLNVSTVGGLPLQCPAGAGVPIVPMFWSPLGRDGTPSGPAVPTDASLVQAWRVGTGAVVYVGAGLFPTRRVFSSAQAGDLEIWKSLIQVIFSTRQAVPPPPPPSPPPPPTPPPPPPTSPSPPPPTSPSPPPPTTSFPPPPTGTVTPSLSPPSSPPVIRPPLPFPVDFPDNCFPGNSLNNGGSAPSATGTRGYSRYPVINERSNGFTVYLDVNEFCDEGLSGGRGCCGQLPTKVEFVINPNCRDQIESVTSETTGAQPQPPTYSDNITWPGLAPSGWENATFLLAKVTGLDTGTDGSPGDTVAFSVRLLPGPCSSPEVFLFDGRLWFSAWANAADGTTNGCCGAGGP